jgi:Plant transposon protein
MANRTSLKDCYDSSGNFIPAKYMLYVNQRDEKLDEDELIPEETSKKRPYVERCSQGYNPQDHIDSMWYKRYVKEPENQQSQKHMKLFRRRFRMDYQSYCDLVHEARDGNWFPKYEQYNAIGHKGICLDILILGALRYLGRGWTFDDISESTGVSEEVHRRFFKDFTVACREHLYPKWVKRPETPEEVEDCMSEFKEAGFDGCIGSADVTHVILEKCHSRLRNQHLGSKSSHATRAFQIVVNHRRQIIASTAGYPGRWNDQTIVRFDGFITDIQRGLYLNDNKFSLKAADGTDEEYSGAWVLVDGGYLNWSTLICPFKESISIKEQRWSRWAESMRKDVECTFGILKGKTYFG